MNEPIGDYEKYRGKCQEFCHELVKENPALKIVRGYYYDPIWNRKEPHWWCVDENDKIHDPTSKQFAAGGIEEFYEVFSGFFECSECGKKVSEEAAIMMGNGNYQVCSDKCAIRLVGCD